jgi:tetratricopeptide (TPR) repeat protein
MDSSRKLRRAGRLPWGTVVVLVAVILALSGSTATGQATRNEAAAYRMHVKPGDKATQQGFIYFYNMEYAPAVKEFEKALANHPNDPYTVNHLLEGVLFQELHREGKLDAELYMSNQFVHMQKQAPDPEAIARVEKLIQRAHDLEEEQLKKNPDDVHALYARSVTRGLRAVKQALVEKEWFSALRSGLGAYDDSKEILKINPNFSDAKLIVGIYNYVVGSLPWPMKMAALLVTIHGSRAKGLALIKEAADADGEASVDARTTLALFLAREKRYKEALELTEWLANAFPHNFIYALSRAGLLKDAGKVPESIEDYRQIIERGKKGEFGNQNVGPAAINLGNLLRSKREWSEAAAAYDSAQTLPHPDENLLANARLAAGEMFDMAGKRGLAVERYQAVLKETKDPELAKRAKELIARPYKGGS